MHRAALAVAVARLLAVQLGHHHVEPGPLRHGVAVPPVGAGDHVLGRQVGHDPRGHRLLADVDVEEAGDLPLQEQIRRRLLEIPDGDHLTIQIKQQWFVQRFHLSPHESK